MTRYDGFKFKRRLPQVGETFLTYQGSCKDENGRSRVNFATVVGLEMWSATGGSIRYVYYDHDVDELVECEVRGHIDPKTYKVI